MDDSRVKVIHCLFESSQALPLVALLSEAFADDIRTIKIRRASLWITQKWFRSAENNGRAKLTSSSVRSRGSPPVHVSYTTCNLQVVSHERDSHSMTILTCWPSRSYVTVCNCLPFGLSKGFAVLNSERLSGERSKLKHTNTQHTASIHSINHFVRIEERCRSTQLLQEADKGLEYSVR